MPAPKVDLKKFAAHMARNKKPEKMTSTQKSLADIRKRADESYDKEYKHHVQGRKDAAADMKRATNQAQMVKAMNKKAHHDKALSKMNRMESVNEMGPRHTSKSMKSRFGSAVDAKKFDAYKKFVKQNNVDEPTVRMIIDNPNEAESKRMMKNKNVAKAVELRKAAMKESNEWVCGKCNCDPCVCESDIHEKLSVGDGMGAWIDDFKKSDAPQFKGKSDKERREMAIAAYLSAKRGDKKESVDEKVITKKMQQRALSKVRAQPKNKVSLPKAPWDKKKKEEGYVSMAQQRAVWDTRKDGGKGHPDNKKGKKK